ncbi:WD_REPEATS_REGION domain-containing protein, partial [Linnemannia gamsii]
MTNNSSKRPVSSDIGGIDSDSIHSTSKHDRTHAASDILPDGTRSFGSSTLNTNQQLLQGRIEWTQQMVYCKVGIVDGQSVFLPIHATERPIEDFAGFVDNDLQTLRKRRLQEYHQPVYIPPVAKANLQAQDDAHFPLMDKVQEFMDSDRQVMLILGDSGAGKSTFNRYLEHQLWTKYNKSYPIPLFINLPAIDKPDQDMVTKQLQAYDFSEHQILEMKIHRQLILICDGYDECQLSTNLHTSNKLNQRGGWRTKMIISCRTQFLGSTYVNLFAPQSMDRYAKMRSDLFQETVIAPFSKEQIKDYIACYVPLEPRPWVAEDYMRMLMTIPSLMDLVKNPFLLILTLEALPGVTKNQSDLSTFRITRVLLYDHFVDQWLGVNMRRLRENKMNIDERKMLEHMIEKGFTHLGVDFSKRLALAIFEKHDGNPVVQYIHYNHKKTWKAMFFGPDPETQFLREASPLIRTGSLHRFIHRSMLEYFFSRTVFEPTTFEVQDEFTPHSKLGLPTMQSLDPTGPLFTRNLLREPSIIQFLSERVRQSPYFEKHLRAVVELSKTDVNVSTAAANAITILVRAGTLFHRADLQDIRIPGADLSGGQFDSAQLQGADLRGVNFTGSWLRQADVSRAQLEDVRFGELPYLKEEGKVTACVYSPDGRMFVTAIGISCRGIINIYNTATWTKMNTFHFDRKMADFRTSWISTKSISFSPDSQRFVTGSYDGIVRLWDCAEGRRLLGVKEGSDENNVSVAFSPCGKWVVSVCGYGNARVWDAETGETVLTMKGHTGRIWCVKYSPDGSRVALGCEDGTIRFWDALAGEPGALWDTPSGDVFCLAFSPDGRQLASGHREGRIRLWNVMSGDTDSILNGHTDDVTCIAFSPSSRWFATSSKDASVKLWDAADGSLISTFVGHTGGVNAVNFSPDGRQLASGSDDGSVRLWEVESGDSRLGWQTLAGVIFNIVFTLDVFFILSSYKDGSLRLWNPLTGAVRFHIRISFEWLGAVAISPDGAHIASGGSDGTLRTWDCQTGEAGPTIEAHTALVNGVVYSPCGRWILSASSGSIQLWDLHNPEKKQILTKRPINSYAILKCMAFSPKRQLVAIGYST